MDDVISRKAAIDVLYKNYILGRGDLNEVLDHIVDRLDKLPSAEPRKKGEWIPQNLNKSDGMISTAVYYYPKCSVCGANANYTNFCPNCGADMRTPVEIARNIVHEVIDNSVWSDTVDTAEMHKVVDDKYAEMTKKTEESKRCDTCKHEKSRWFSRCADCSDYELWEGKDETGRSTTEN